MIEAKIISAYFETTSIFRKLHKLIAEKNVFPISSFKILSITLYISVVQNFCCILYFIHFPFIVIISDIFKILLPYKKISLIYLME